MKAMGSAKEQISYRWMEPGDIPALIAVAHRSWHSTYPAIIPQEQIDYMLSEGYSAAALGKQLEQGHRFLLAETESAGLVGFLSVEAMADHHFIHKFYICPNRQGQGIGGGLLRELLEVLPEIRLLRLFVNRQNENAIAFYKKQNFQVAAEVNTDIGGGFTKTDYVMERKIYTARE